MGTEQAMKSEMLMALGLVLVVMCNGISTESSVTPLLGEAAYSTVDAASAKDLPPKLLQVPGIPKGHKVVKRIQDVTESGDKNCSGFQYVAAEQLCKLLEPPPRIKVKKITLKKAKTLATKKAKKAVKKLKRKEKKKMKKALKTQKKAMAPKKKKPTAGQIYRESSKKMRLRKAEYKKSVKVSKQATRNAKGARAAEIITKTNEHHEMMKELKAAKQAQEAGLNFEEQAIMAKTMADKKVLIAKAHKVGAMAAEEKQDAKFEKSKLIMKKGLKLRMDMKTLKIKKAALMVAAKVKMNAREAKNKIAQKNYNVFERKQKNKADEKKVKLAKKARLYLKKQDKIAERNQKAKAAAKAGSKKKKIEKCHKSQVKMRKTKFKILRRLKKTELKKERKIANKKVRRLKKGLRKAEKRKAKAIKKKKVKMAKHEVRMRFQMSLADAEDLAESMDVAVSAATMDMAIKGAQAKVNRARINKDKAKVAAKFTAKREKKAAKVAKLKMKLALKPKNAKLKIAVVKAKAAVRKGKAGLKKADAKVASLKSKTRKLAKKAKS